MSSPQPTATGRLASTPLSHILVYLVSKKLSGTLIVEEPGGKKSALYVRLGAPAKARTSEPVIYLGRLLLDQGAIDEKTLNASLEQVAAQKKLHGQVLLASRAIDAQTLRAALAEQVLRKLVWMFRLSPECAYGFYEGANFLERWGGPESTPVEPLAALWAGLRNHGDADRPETFASQLGGAQLRLHAAAQPSRFQFGPKEKSVIDLLRVKPQPLDMLLGSGLGDPMMVKRVIYALSITRHLDLGDAGSEPVGVDDVPPSKPPPRATNTSRRTVATTDEPEPASQRSGRPPMGSSPDGKVEAPEVTALRKVIVERAAACDKQSYYDLLGVTQNASVAQVQAAFFGLAKLWHPDRLRPELAGHKEQVTRVFARMSEAHQILTDEARRKEYDALLESGGSSDEEQEKVQKVIRAATNFQKAEVFYKKHDLASAETYAKKAFDDDPEQGEYIAFYAWIQAQKPERLQTRRYDDLIGLLDQALTADPKSKRIHLYRAQLMKLAGRARDAIKEFRWIAENDPQNVEAKRELRLWEMRRGAGSNDQEPPPRERRSQPPPGRPRSSDKPGKGAPKGKDGGLLDGDVGQLFGKLFKR